MKIPEKVTMAFSILSLALAVAACESGPKVTVKEMENKGTSMNVPAPDWIKNYTANGITAVQNQSQYKDKYCIIGEESGVNKQFVLTWADNFSAQQRIGAMLRTTIASEYQARVQGSAQSAGGANSSSAQGAGSGDFSQQIDNVINAIVNVSYSGAQREADWWSLRRRYDPDQKDVYTDEYTAYVLYTIPKSELNRQVAAALETSVDKDSALYDVTIGIARSILQNEFSILGDGAAAGSASSAQASSGREYKIGAVGPAGGVVFYDKGVFSNGWRYLEAAPKDVGPTQWGANGTNVSGTNTAAGTGKDNTQRIVPVLNQRGEDGAALLCTALNVNGKTDWFLPSKDELDLMYVNLQRKGLGGFDGNFYWSSSQDGSDYAWAQKFSDGSQSGAYSSQTYKNNTYLVRAVRAF